MDIHIVAVGRVRSGEEKGLFDDYVDRLPWPVSLREVEERRPLSVPERQSREAHRLLERLPAEAVVVAMDVRGEVLSSEAFAQRVGVWRDEGTRILAFLIGGSEGHGTAVLERADLVLSLGSMTWPHLLVRVMLAEQLYRASSILSGHPYHRG